MSHATLSFRFSYSAQLNGGHMRGQNLTAEKHTKDAAAVIVIRQRPDVVITVLSLIGCCIVAIGMERSLLLGSRNMCNGFWVKFK